MANVVAQPYSHLLRLGHPHTSSCESFPLRPQTVSAPSPLLPQKLTSHSRSEYSAFCDHYFILLFIFFKLNIYPPMSYSGPFPSKVFFFEYLFKMSFEHLSKWKRNTELSKYLQTSRCMAGDTDHFSLTFTKYLVCARHNSFMKITAGISRCLLCVGHCSKGLLKSIYSSGQCYTTGTTVIPILQKKKRSTERVG